MTCLKTRYKDKKQANSALHSIINKSDNRDCKPCRSYFCPNCSSYHLTKNSKFGEGADTIFLKHFNSWFKLINNNI